MSIGIYFCSCGESYTSDFDFNKVNCLSCRSEIEVDSNLTLQKLNTLTPRQVKHLWEMFADTPINNMDEIEEPYLIWKKGTNRFDIWKWFDQQHPNGVASLDDTFRNVNLNDLHLQECKVCGHQFNVRYRWGGRYEYTGDQCKCNASFTPAEGVLSIQEWMIEKGFMTRRNKIENELA